VDPLKIKKNFDGEINRELGRSLAKGGHQNRTGFLSTDKGTFRTVRKNFQIKIIPSSRPWSTSYCLPGGLLTPFFDRP